MTQNNARMLDVLNRISWVRPTKFIAPIPAAKSVTVNTMADGVPFRYIVQNPRPGWWELQPNPAAMREAIQVEEAVPFQYLPYLGQLPAFNVIALFNTDERGNWLVTPYNLADAAQRGWQNGEPRVVYLTRGHDVRPYDVLTVRDLAGVLLFDDINTRLGRSDLFKGPAWFLAVSIVDKHAADLKEALRKAHLEEKRKTVRGRMEAQLEFMNARLLGMAGYGDGYRVRWQSPDGHEYEMTVRQDLHIESAGICLANTDANYNLSSIVHVMEEARRLRRPDLT